MYTIGLSNEAAIAASSEPRRNAERGLLGINLIIRLVSASRAKGKEVNVS